MKMLTVVLFLSLNFVSHAHAESISSDEAQSGIVLETGVYFSEGSCDLLVSQGNKVIVLEQLNCGSTSGRVGEFDETEPGMFVYYLEEDFRVVIWPLNSESFKAERQAANSNGTWRVTKRELYIKRS